jgi:hypothetical protein
MGDHNIIVNDSEDVFSMTVELNDSFLVGEEVVSSFICTRSNVI